jgi:hypothetical protein
MMSRKDLVEDCVAKTVRKHAFIDCGLQLSDHHLEATIASPS